MEVRYEVEAILRHRGTGDCSSTRCAWRFHDEPRRVSPRHPHGTGSLGSGPIQPGSLHATLVGASKALEEYATRKKKKSKIERYLLISWS